MSGTLGAEMFYERVSFSCDRRSVHGWLLTYPVAERQFYDKIVEDMHVLPVWKDRRLALQRQRPPAGRKIAVPPIDAPRLARKISRSA